MDTNRDDGAADVARPDGPDGITAEWMTAALRAKGYDVTVERVRRSGIGEGVGMMSGLARLDLDYSAGDGPASMILKFPATNEANLAVARSFDLYRREVLYYRDVAPRSSAWTPTIYYADIADDGVDFVLLMEDLSRYRLGDQIEGCDLTDTEHGIEWLARQHASFWDAVEDPSLDFLPYVAPSYSSEVLTQGCEIGWAPMVEAFASVLPPHIRDLKATFLRALPALFAWMSTPPLTVVHGDFRMDNLFFGDGPDEEPLVAVDWQGSLRGRATQDLAYFMTGSVTTDVRRAHERELVEAWREGLVAAGVSGYSADDAWEDYRRGVAYVWTIAVVVAGTLDRTNERANAWMSVMLERSVAAIDDLGIVDLVAELADTQG